MELNGLSSILPHKLMGMRGGRKYEAWDDWLVAVGNSQEGLGLLQRK